jgi:hypothetical protein
MTCDGAIRRAALVVFDDAMTTLYATACCGVPSSLFSAFFAGLAALVVVVVVIGRWLERRRADRLARWPVGNLPESTSRKETT